MRTSLLTATAFWLALSTATQPAAAEHLWWAVSELWAAKGIETFGAAWNYPTPEEAAKAAVEACRERSAAFEFPCREAGYGTHSCFLIMRFPRAYYGRRAGWGSPYATTKGFKTRAKAEAHSREMMASGTYAGVEVLECAGVD